MRKRKVKEKEVPKKFNGKTHKGSLGAPLKRGGSPNPPERT